jgi:aryl-alcohol dehydrogenase-like predicted oxidoreductase
VAESILRQGAKHSRGEALRAFATRWHGCCISHASPIVGAKRPEQLADNIAATKVTLSAADLEQIDNCNRLPSEYPGWMFERQGEYRRKQLAESSKT